MLYNTVDGLKAYVVNISLWMFFFVAIHLNIRGRHWFVYRANSLLTIGSISYIHIYK